MGQRRPTSLKSDVSEGIAGLLRLDPREFHRWSLAKKAAVSSKGRCNAMNDHSKEGSFIAFVVHGCQQERRWSCGSGVCGRLRDCCSTSGRSIRIASAQTVGLKSSPSIFKSPSDAIRDGMPSTTSTAIEREKASRKSNSRLAVNKSTLR